MPTVQLSNFECTSIDNTLRLLIKKSLGCQSNAANGYLYGSNRDGLFEIPLAAEDSDITN